MGIKEDILTKEKQLFKLQITVGEKNLATKWQRMVDGDWELCWIDDEFLSNMVDYYREEDPEYNPSDMCPVDYAESWHHKENLGYGHETHHCFSYNSNFWEFLTTKELSEFIKEGADVNAKNGGGWTPLHWTAEQARGAGIIGGLVCLGADVNAKSDNSDTPLHVAIEHNKNIEVIKELINAGADVNAKDSDGNTPLHGAASRNDNHVIRELINARANVNAKNNLGWTPLHTAASDRYRWDCVRLRDNTISTMRELIKAGADIHAKDGDGGRYSRTPFDIAVLNNRSFEFFRALIKAEVNDWHESRFWNATPLHKNATPLHKYAFSNESIEVIKKQIKAGEDIHAVDDKGETLLHIVAKWSNDIEIIRALIEEDDDMIYAKDNAGRTPYDFLLYNSFLKDNKDAIALLNPTP